MAEVVSGDSTDIHPDFSFHFGPENLLLSAHCVVHPQLRRQWNLRRGIVGFGANCLGDRRRGWRARRGEAADAPGGELGEGVGPGGAESNRPNRVREER